MPSRPTRRPSRADRSNDVYMPRIRPLERKCRRRAHSTRAGKVATSSASGTRRDQGRPAGAHVTFRAKGTSLVDGLPSAAATCYASTSSQLGRAPGDGPSSTAGAMDVWRRGNLRARSRPRRTTIAGRQSCAQRPQSGLIAGPVQLPPLLAVVALLSLPSTSSTFDTSDDVRRTGTLPTTPVSRAAPARIG